MPQNSGFEIRSFGVRVRPTVNPQTALLVRNDGPAIFAALKINSVAFVWPISGAVVVNRYRATVEHTKLIVTDRLSCGRPDLVTGGRILELGANSKVVFYFSGALEMDVSPEAQAQLQDHTESVIPLKAPKVTYRAALTRALDAAAAKADSNEAEAEGFSPHHTTTCFKNVNDSWSIEEGQILS